MTFTYEPGGAAIAWLTLSQVLSDRAAMQKALLALSGENSKVQISLTENSADQTLKDLNAQAEGLRQNAIFTMTGAAAGFATSLGTFAGALATRPQGEASTTKTSIELKEQANEVEMETFPSIENQTGTAELIGQQPSSSQAPTAPANKETAAEKETTPPGNALNKYLSENGYTLASTMQTGIQSYGSLQQATYTAKQAEAKSIEVIAQGIASVAKAQGDMINSGISSNDAFSNNVEGAFTTIIQVSAVRA